MGKPPPPFQTEDIPPLSKWDRRAMMFAMVLAFPIKSLKAWREVRKDRDE